VNLQKNKLFFLIISIIFSMMAVPQYATAITTANCRDSFGTPGNVTVSVVGTDCLLRFTGSSTWTIPSGTTTVKFLLVGGGASGAIDGGGGGGGGGGLYHSSLSVSASTVANVVVGAGASIGWSASAGEQSKLDANGDGAYEWIAAGGSAGDAWATRVGGLGGSTSAQSGATALTGGRGGKGPNTQTVNTAAYENGSDGFSSDITGSTIFYGGGGGGGIGSHSYGTGQIDVGYSAGGKGGGGAGAAQRSRNTNVTWTYTGIENSSTTQSITAACAANYYGTTTGFGGLNGYGGGGGGGSAFGDGCIGSPNAYNDGERNAGGAGGSGVVYIRYTPDATSPTITGPSSATGATSSISVIENTTVVHTFTANESVTWSKSGTDNSFFAITSGGVLTITARNFESPADVGGDNTYVVVITATDNSTNATSQTLTVTITNVNEAPTITTNSSAATHSVTQAENISAVITYAATDVDAGTSLAWSISGTDAADFSIAGSGALTFASNPDYEAPADSDANNSYIVVVTVSDGSLTDTQTITITITNANENASVDAPTISGTVYKGVTSTITVTINVSGKVRFYVGGKRISTCKERVTSGTYPNNSATCSWKPPVTGKQILTATLTPTDNTFAASTSAPTEVFVQKRATVR
jgi:VCBS repeat-containing protein